MFYKYQIKRMEAILDGKVYIIPLPIRASIRINIARILFIEYLVKLFHDRYNHHFLTGLNLTHIDNQSYPYCKVCGARPKEGFLFKWFYKSHVEIRNLYGFMQFDRIPIIRMKDVL